MGQTSSRIHKWQFIVRGVVVELLIMAVSLRIYIYLEEQSRVMCINGFS